MSRRQALRLSVAALVLVASAGGVALVASAEPPKEGYAHDPAPVANRKQWVFEVGVREGKVTVDRATALSLEKPAETARVLGRFAIELYVGRELLDRVRFNVPLVEHPSPSKTKGLPRPRLEDHVAAKLSIRMADHPRTAYMLFVDRDTGETQKFDWPPQPDGRFVPWSAGIADGGSEEVGPGSVKAARVQDGGLVFPKERATDAGSAAR